MSPLVVPGLNCELLMLSRYPAGFVYVFMLLYYFTGHGTNVSLAQWIFAALYLVNLSVVLSIYRHLFKVCGFILMS